LVLSWLTVCRYAKILNPDGLELMADIDSLVNYFFDLFHGQPQDHLIHQLFTIPKHTVLNNLSREGLDRVYHLSCAAHDDVHFMANFNICTISFVYLAGSLNSLKTLAALQARHSPCPEVSKRRLIPVLVCLSLIQAVETTAFCCG
jgi:hypothetical protein